MTTHPQTNRILTALAALTADLDAILRSGQSGRITLNIGAGGNVRIEVARFQDVPKEESRNLPLRHDFCAQLRRRQPRIGGIHASGGVQRRGLRAAGDAVGT